MKLTYCKRCVMSNTRPKLNFDKEGVCDACRATESKDKNIDWADRERQLKSIFDKFRRKKGEIKYDCIVPVSGGKDSIYQVHVVKNVYGMNPLCLTFRPDARTVIGEKNIQALRDMGVDHIDFTPNPVGFKKLRRKAFLEEGDCSLPDHLIIWNMVPSFAVRLKIPLIVWGENPDMEYGAPKDEWDIPKLNRDWMKRQNILKGKSAKDWVDETLSLEEIQSLMGPTEKEMDEVGLTPIFLGYYLPWDCKDNAKIAVKHGFVIRERPIMGLYNYSDLDCMYIVIHHYFKWFKFGFNRITDNACNEIRKGRLTRNEAIKLIKERDGIKPPKEFIAHFCKAIKITEKQFWEVADKYRNKNIWKKDSNGEWYIENWICGDKIPDRFPYEQLTDKDIK